MVIFHKGFIFFQNDPDAAIMAQLIVNNQLHVNSFSIFKTHSFSEPRVLIVEMLIPVESYI